MSGGFFGGILKSLADAAQEAVQQAQAEAQAKARAQALAAQRAAGARRAPRSVAAPPPESVDLPPAVAPEPFPMHESPVAPRAAGSFAGLFEDGDSLVRAVIAAEVLGPPLALREHSPWSPRPNEPSTSAT